MTFEMWSCADISLERVRLIQVGPTLTWSKPSNHRFTLGYALIHFDKKGLRSWFATPYVRLHPNQFMVCPSSNLCVLSRLPAPRLMYPNKNIKKILIPRFALFIDQWLIIFLNATKGVWTQQKSWHTLGNNMHKREEYPHKWKEVMYSGFKP